MIISVHPATCSISFFLLSVSCSVTFSFPFLFIFRYSFSFPFLFIFCFVTLCLPLHISSVSFYLLFRYSLSSVTCCLLLLYVFHYFLSSVTFFWSAVRFFYFLHRYLYRTASAFCIGCIRKSNPVLIFQAQTADDISDSISAFLSRKCAANR